MDKGFNELIKCILLVAWDIDLKCYKAGMYDETIRQRTFGGPYRRRR